jgi:aryl-alcohol dehydrogenase-like predicted oxidoreductase
VQIIFNIFRQKPADYFFRLAQAKQVGILARVPLASGLLTGKITPETQFAADDHRNFNRYGESFDVGETFSGVDLEAAFVAHGGLKPRDPPGDDGAVRLRWILMFDAVSCAIPGAKRPNQVADNCSASDMPAIDEHVMRSVRVIYDTYIRDLVHYRW